MRFAVNKSGLVVPSWRIAVPHVETVRADRDNLTLEFWGGECGLSLSPLPIHGERIEMREHNPYRAEHGGIGCFRVLTQRPKSCELFYDLDSWGLDFFHQPALKLAGHHRPEHIVNSYAIYHKTKGGMVESSGPDYKTGKAAHLYRSWAEDADGWRVWVPQGFNRSRSLLKLTLPEDFRRKARLPITVDPDFGYTSLGGSIQQTQSGLLFATTGDLGESGTLVSCSIGGGGFGEDAQMGVYTNADPRAYKDETGSVEVAPFASQAFATANVVVGASLTAATYQLMAQFDGDNFYWAYDAGTRPFSWIAETFGDWDASYAASGFTASYGALVNGSVIVSLYATYTAAAGGSTYPGYISPFGWR